MWSRRIGVTQALEVVRGGNSNFMTTFVLAPLLLTYISPQRATKFGLIQDFTNNSSFSNFVNTLLLALRAFMPSGVPSSIASYLQQILFAEGDLFTLISDSLILFL